MRTSSMPSRETTSPLRSCRPRRSSGSPLTRTPPAKRTSFTWAPVGTASTSLSSWPRRMVSSPGRISTVRTATSLVSGRDEHVAGAHPAGRDDGGTHRQQAVALAVDRLEHRGVAGDPARLRPRGHDAPGDGQAEPQSDPTHVHLATAELVLARAVQD